MMHKSGVSRSRIPGEESISRDKELAEASGAEKVHYNNYADGHNYYIYCQVIMRYIVQAAPIVRMF